MAKLKAKKPAAKPKVKAAVKPAIARELKAKAADAKIKGGQETAMGLLKPIATEVNQILELANRSEDQAYDRRLTAAIHLEKARKIADKAKINFKKWCETNVTQSYETVRKLVTIGGSPDPKQALEDMRGRNKKANKKLREKKTLLLQGKTPPEDAPYIRAEKALSAMKDKEQHTFLDSKAKKLGFRVISNDEMKVLAQVKNGNVSTPTILPSKKASVDPIEALKEGFMAMKAGQMVEFVKWAVAKVGGKFVDGFDAGEDGLEIPAALDRRGKVTAGKTA